MTSPGHDPLHTATARRTVRAMARRYPPSVERDDLMQEALLRIWLHTQEHGPVTPEHAVRLTRWAVLDYLRRDIAGGRSRPRALNPVTLVPLEDHHEPATGDTTFALVAARQQLARVEAAWSALTDRERAALEEGACSAANAGRWGVSRSRISQVGKSTRRKLQEAAA